MSAKVEKYKKELFWRLICCSTLRASSWGRGAVGIVDLILIDLFHITFHAHLPAGAAAGCSMQTARGDRVNTGYASWPKSLRHGVGAGILRHGLHNGLSTYPLQKRVRVMTPRHLAPQFKF